LRPSPVKAFAASEWHLVEKQPDNNIEDLLGMGNADVLGIAKRAAGDFLRHFEGMSKLAAIADKASPAHQLATHSLFPEV
jgi:hypothetical protein